MSFVRCWCGWRECNVATVLLLLGVGGLLPIFLAAFSAAQRAGRVADVAPVISGVEAGE